MIAAPRRDLPMERLRQRADFVAAASGIRASAGAFILQARARHDTKPPRFGFTVTKKVGNAPERNRVRRRLKEMVRLTAVNQARAGQDYVLIGRRAALAMPFAQLVAEFEGALKRVHTARAPRPAPGERHSDRRARPPGGETQR